MGAGEKKGLELELELELEVEVQVQRGCVSLASSHAPVGLVGFHHASFKAQAL